MQVDRFYKKGLYFLGVVAAMAFASCSSEEIEPDQSRDGGQIRVVADLSQTLFSRADGDEAVSPWITEGLYYLSYPKPDPNNEYNVATVDFDEFGNGIGVITVPPASELRWLSVGGGSTPTFYLDNVDPALNTETTDSVNIVFGAENPYVAGVFDGDFGSNDLLWGSKMESRNTGTINFDLHHNMSRVRVIIEVDNTDAMNETRIDLSNATVKLTSINQTPISFNRLDGTLELNTDEESKAENYTPLTLISPDETDRTWKETSESDDGNILTYTTKDFVLPPQSLLENTDRPKLEITLPNGDVYSGILPNAMLVLSETTGGLDYPVVLSFLKEYILTIHTVITQEPPSLSFMPVYVVQWVDKGTFDMEAHQAGIYTADEFYKMTQYYSAGNAYQLDRYGELHEEDGEEPHWTFVFFHSVMLDFNKIRGSMIPGTNGMKDFNFEFTNYGISVYNGDVETAVSVTPQELFNIVSNPNAPFPSK